MLDSRRGQAAAREDEELDLYWWYRLIPRLF
jgi:hypothetical protein